MRTNILNATSTNLFAARIPGVTVTEIERTPAGLLLTALAVVLSATCPRCETASTRMQSYDTRRPHDLPVCGLPVRHARSQRDKLGGSCSNPSLI